jgi:hypothetical protein
MPRGYGGTGILWTEFRGWLLVPLDASVSNIVSCCGGLSRIKNADEAGYLIGYNRLVDLWRGVRS